MSVPLRVSPAPWSSAAFESTGTASPRPAPQSASAQTMKPTLAEGSSASPTSPTASSAAPPQTAVSGGSLSGRTASAASGSALTIPAPAIGE